MVAPGFRRFLVPVARLAPIEPFLWPVGALQECVFQPLIERDEIIITLRRSERCSSNSSIVWSYSKREEDSRNYGLGEFIAPGKKTS